MGALQKLPMYVCSLDWKCVRDEHADEDYKARCNSKNANPSPSPLKSMKAVPVMHAGCCEASARLHDRNILAWRRRRGGQVGRGQRGGEPGADRWPCLHGWRRAAMLINQRLVNISECSLAQADYAYRLNFLHINAFLCHQATTFLAIITPLPCLVPSAAAARAHTYAQTHTPGLMGCRSPRQFAPDTPGLLLQLERVVLHLSSIMHSIRSKHGVSDCVSLQACSST